MKAEKATEWMHLWLCCRSLARSDSEKHPTTRQISIISWRRRPTITTLCRLGRSWSGVENVFVENVKLIKLLATHETLAAVLLSISGSGAVALRYISHGASTRAGLAGLAVNRHTKHINHKAIRNRERETRSSVGQCVYGLGGGPSCIL